MVEVRALENCMEEDIYKFAVEGIPAAELRERLSSLGAVRRPLPDTGLVRMDEPEFVVTGNLESGTFQLRIKTTADGTGVKERFVRTMETATRDDVAGRG